MTRRRSTSLVTVVACLAVAMPLAAGSCRGAEQSGPRPSGAPAGSVFGRTVTIGLHSDQPGWSVFTAPNRWAGFDYDLGNWLANRYGFTAAYTPVASLDREAVIEKGVVRLVIATYSMTDARREKVGQAGPYAQTQQGVLVRAGDNRIRTVADLRTVLVCVAEGTTSEKQLRALGVEPVPRPGFDQCRRELTQGLVDAVSTDLLILHGYAQGSDGRLAVVPGVVFGNLERYGIGFARGDTALCRELTSAIKTFIADGYWDRFFASSIPGVTGHASKPNPNLLGSC